MSQARSEGTQLANLRPEFKFVEITIKWACLHNVCSCRYPTALRTILRQVTKLGELCEKKLGSGDKVEL